MLFASTLSSNPGDFVLCFGIPSNFLFIYSSFLKKTKAGLIKTSKIIENPTKGMHQHAPIKRKEKIYDPN